MAYQAIDTTLGAGDTAKAGGDKINANFVELYGVTDASFKEALQDMIGAFVNGTAGGGIVVTYDDAGNAESIVRAPVSGLTTAAVAIAAADSIEIDQGGAVKRATGAMVRDFVGTAYGLKLNNATNADPTVASDSAAGYAAGSTWFNTSTGAMWRCYSAGVGAAVWDKQAYNDHPSYVVANWYAAAAAAVAAGTAITANSIKLMPAILKHRVTISQLSALVTTLFAGGNVQFAIYASDPTTKRPTGNALVTTGSISTAATGIVSAAFTGAATLQLEPGNLYWFAVCADNSTNVFLTPTALQSNVDFSIGSATVANVLATASLTHLAVSQTFGTWPSLTAATFTEQLSTKCPLLAFLVSSVP